MAYRNDLDALAQRHAALEAEVTTKTRERDEARELLEDARAKTRLPVLDNIRVASPCKADWQQMTGDARVRACASCNKRVYNLSEMTREEAQALIVEHEGKMCARFYRRSDGTIITKDCEIGAAQRRRRRWIAVGAAALLGGGGFAAYRAAMPDTSMMGNIAMPGDESPSTQDRATQPDTITPDRAELLMGDIDVSRDVK